ncbi:MULTISPECIES: hypothetical protein [Rhizobium]|uniref:hypothetical protein n=1 Tax=Rhizobium TaxID=379 RepID=UPI0004840B55|nr:MULTISPECIES: hypothetical protein [Rhizobium]TBC65032.1 hypothetical protein ELH36_20935 [Rhizobium ruizarguesonis]WFT84953.1 hypothetical protein QA638_18890 [Rhizobium leguminosarum]
MNKVDRSPADYVPATVVIDIPAWVTHLGERTVVPLPILIVMQDGEATVPSDTFEFAVDRAAVEKFEALHRILATIARLHDEWRASRIPLNSAEDADTIIWNYLYSRLAPPAPVAYETIRTDFRDICSFVRFCRRNPRLKSHFAQALAKGSKLFEDQMPVRKTKGFLQHLDSHRRRWLELQDFEADMPRDLKKLAAPMLSSVAKITMFPTEQQMDDLIDLERNPMFKAAWCVLAAQGPRFAELLHMWRCDVLPPSFAARFTARPDANPFLIYAHPEQCLYTGESFARNVVVDRKMVLKEKYRTVSRLKKVEPNERLGWKSMLLFDARKLSWGFWMVERYARIFEGLLPTIWAFHDEAGSDRRHPYLFANCRNDKYFGSPMTKQNLQRAYVAACERVGLEPIMEAGGHGHGMRHFCAWYAEAKNLLDAPERQLVLRQKSQDSQEEYGRRLADLHAKMSGRG